MISKRVLSRASTIAAVAVVAGGSLGAGALHIEVTADVNGTSTEMSAFGTTVGTILERNGIAVGENDLVSPGLDARVDDGDEIVVRHARPLTVNLDGTETTHWTTALTVDEALTDLDVRADGAVLSADRSQAIGRDGTELDITTPKQVTVTIDGKVAFDDVTTAATVGDLFGDLGWPVTARDVLSHNGSTPLTDGMAIDWVNKDYTEVSEASAVPHGTVEQKTGDLFAGEQQVETEGVNGQKTTVYGVEWTSYQESGRTALSEKVTKEPVDEVVLVGTKERPAPEPEPARASADDSAAENSASDGSSDASASTSASRSALRAPRHDRAGRAGRAGCRAEDRGAERSHRGAVLEPRPARLQP